MTDRYWVSRWRGHVPLMTAVEQADEMVGISTRCTRTELEADT